MCFPDAPAKVRKPDASFIRRGRLPGEALPDGFCPIPPDVAAEVVSPNDLAYEVDEKVGEWLRAGVRLVWVINPRARIVAVHRRSTSDHTRSVTSPPNVMRSRSPNASAQSRK